jgi:hypothetical protein
MQKHIPMTRAAMAIEWKTIKLLVHIASKMSDASKDETYFKRSLECPNLPIQG